MSAQQSLCGTRGPKAGPLRDVRGSDSDLLLGGLALWESSHVYSGHIYMVVREMAMCAPVYLGNSALCGETYLHNKVDSGHIHALWNMC